MKTSDNLFRFDDIYHPSLLIIIEGSGIKMWWHICDQIWVTDFYLLWLNDNFPTLTLTCNLKFPTKWFAGIPVRVISVTITSHERHGVSHHLHFECFFNNMLKITTKKHRNSSLMGNFERNPMGQWCGYLFPCHDVVMRLCFAHYCDVIMSTMASQITDVSNVYSTVCSGAN